MRVEYEDDRLRISYSLEDTGTAVIAFSSQSPVRPALVSFETRWPDWRSGVAQWDLPDAATLADEVGAHLFFGRGDSLDMQHAARFAAADLPGRHIYRVAGTDHDLVRD